MKPRDDGTPSQLADLSFGYLQSPLGWMRFEAAPAALIALDFCTGTPDLRDLPTPTPFLKEAVSQVSAYFDGKLKQFSLPLAPVGTEFQQRVWAVLLTIPYGKTWSYLDLAETVGGRLHTRAVGLANGKNPLALVAPCHRVIGSDGSLTGYAGGLWRKKWLLAHEGLNSGTGVQGSLFDFPT